ncbi:MAG: hypothetical protein QOD66_1680 [Solirubrobacteraceae bacterium]|jgi:hypothetical protein|nr:hypothetical protein [Solirubrobacteraceae bacterium]
MAEVRTTRAYIAGFGTAGSLLAGAAAVFVLASAFVSFHGWPQLDNQLSAPALVRASTHAGGDAIGSRRLAAVLAAQRAASTRLTASTAGGPGIASRSTATSPAIGTGGSHIGATAGTRPAITPVTPAGSSPACASGCSGGSPGTTTISGTVQATTGSLGNTVAGSGASLGSTVSGVVSTLAGNVNTLSSSLAGSSLAGALGQSGQAVGTAVTSATGTAGAALSGAGNTAGALLGGH